MITKFYAPSYSGPYLNYNTVYISTSANRVQELNRTTGALIRSFPAMPYGINDMGLNPYNGHLYMVGYSGTNGFIGAINLFNGTLLFPTVTISSFAPATIGFNSTNGDVFTGSLNTSTTIYRYSAAGALITSWAFVDFARCIAVYSATGEVYAFGGSSTGYLRRYSSTGTLNYSYPNQGGVASGMAVDQSNGDVYSISGAVSTPRKYTLAGVATTYGAFISTGARDLRINQNTKDFFVTGSTSFKIRKYIATGGTLDSTAYGSGSDFGYRMCYSAYDNMVYQGGSTNIGRRFNASTMALDSLTYTVEGTTSYCIAVF